MTRRCAGHWTEGGVKKQTNMANSDNSREKEEGKEEEEEEGKKKKRIRRRKDTAPGLMKLLD